MPSSAPSTPRWLKEFKPTPREWLPRSVHFSEDKELKSQVTKHNHFPSTEKYSPLMGSAHRAAIDNAFFSSKARADAIHKSLIEARKQAFHLYHKVRDTQGQWPSDANQVFQESPHLSTNSMAPHQGSQKIPALTVGTDCSGLEAPIQALNNIGIQHSHLFSCENDIHCRKTILNNFPPLVLQEDTSKRQLSSTPKVDLYICGFPCQAFSTMGKQKGMKDPRGRVFYDVHARRPSTRYWSSPIA